MLNENERIKVNDFIERAIKELKNKPTTDVSLIKSILWNSFNEDSSNENNFKFFKHFISNSNFSCFSLHT